MGRHCTELLNWSKSKDYDYIEYSHNKDKIPSWSAEMRKRIENPDKSVFHIEPQTGQMKNGRIADGLVHQHDPHDTLRYISQPMPKQRYDSKLFN